MDLYVMEQKEFDDLIERANKSIMEMDKALMDSENAFEQLKREIYELYKHINNGNRSFD